MVAKPTQHDWIEDFSILLTRQAIRRKRSDPDLELFVGSKKLASLWLGAVACLAGALGGLLPTGALWDSVLYPIAWLVVVVVLWVVAVRLTTPMAGPALAFLAGWCVFWGLLAGIVAGWSVQLGTAGWAYGIAGGLGFLVGLVHGNLQHADIRGHESWAMIGTALAPVGTCLAALLFRTDLVRLGELQAAALAGLLAALVFLGPAMALYLARWDNERALLRLASLYLHNDAFIAEAIALLDRAIRLSPEDAALLDRRALAHALKGDMASAEADWAAHRTAIKDSRSPDVSLGWLHLRRERLPAAADAFDRALGGKSTRHWATIGRSLVHLRSGEPARAIDLLRGLRAADIDARTETYRAQAHLAIGDLSQAIESASVAIDELDSVHGLSWLIRAQAHVALGSNDHAIADLNRALAAADEAGVEERALQELGKIDGDVLEEDELEKLEQSLASRS